MDDEHERYRVNQALLDRARMGWHAWGREHPEYPHRLANALSDLDQIAASAGLR